MMWTLHGSVCVCTYSKWQIPLFLWDMPWVPWWVVEILDSFIWAVILHCVHYHIYWWRYVLKPIFAFDSQFNVRQYKRWRFIRVRLLLNICSTMFWNTRQCRKRWTLYNIILNSTSGNSRTTTWAGLIILSCPLIKQGQYLAVETNTCICAFNV